MYTNNNILQTRVFWNILDRGCNNFSYCWQTCRRAKFHWFSSAMHKIATRGSL